MRTPAVDAISRDVLRRNGLLRDAPKIVATITKQSGKIKITNSEGKTFWASNEEAAEEIASRESDRLGGMYEWK